MSIEVREMNGLFRVVDRDTGLPLLSKNNNPIDGGGSTDNQKAERQAGHIRVGLAKKAAKENG